MRTLYRFLLLVHPPAFRRRFAAEMLCIFDQASPATGALPLLFDALASLARQWILRSRSWMLPAAVGGACLQIVAGGLIWIAFRHGESLPREPLPAAPLDRLIAFILASVGALVLMVTAASLWMRQFTRARSRHPRTAR